ncbi:MAG: deiodinase [Rhizobiales bacterium]|nr:deiodinase [Hyphomicrobiales bacterium]
MRLNEIYQTYNNHIAIYVIYIREAHADNGWRVPENLEHNIHFDEPTTDDERTEVASVCQIGLDLKIPMLIDSIDNDVDDKYIGLPMRLFLIDRQGKIAYAGDRGPFGFDPDSWEQAIMDELPAVG